MEAMGEGFRILCERKRCQKTALLLHTAMDVQDIFETLDDVPFVAAVEGEVDNVYKQALRKLNACFTPQLNVPYERHVFRSMKQGDETVDQFVARLKTQAINCNFGNDEIRDKQIRDQVVDACKSSYLRRKLLWTERC